MATTFETIKNNLSGALAEDYTTGDGELVLIDASSFPTITPPSFLRVTLGSVIYKVVGKTGNTLDIDGTLEGTVDINFPANTPVRGLFTVGHLSSVYTAINTLENLTYSSEDITDFDSAVGSIITTEKGSANGLASLGSDSKIPSSQLPAISITDTFVVASQAAMLALTAQTGDVAVRTDTNQSYILKGSSASTLADWELLRTPTDSVLSVNTQTGTVVLTTTHISEGTNLYHTSARVNTIISSATIAQSQVTNLSTDLSSKAPLASPALTGVPTAPTADPGTNTTQIATTAFVLANLNSTEYVEANPAGLTLSSLSTEPTSPGVGDLWVDPNEEGGSSGGLSDAYTIITDGTTPANASGSDTFKLRSANSILTIAVGNDNATHGDNALFTVVQSVIDHGSIAGLADDDHTQYLNNIRGDVRYYTKSEIDTSLAAKVTSGRLTAVRVYTSNATWTKPADIFQVIVEVIGGGGGGGGVTGTNSNVGAAGGGGGGGYSRTLVLAASLASTVAVTVGNGGTAGANTGGTGGTGGDSSFGAHAVGSGGFGGVGQTAGTALGVAAGGAGGAASAGTRNTPGQPGVHGYRASGTFGWGGAGGASGHGQGMGGQGLITGAAGNTGTGAGGGGSGAFTTTNVNRLGGAGATGMVVVQEYSV